MSRQTWRWLWDFFRINEVLWY